MHHSTATPAHTGKPTPATHPAHRSPAAPVEVERPTTGTTAPAPLVTTGTEPNGDTSAEVRKLSARQLASRRQPVMWKITRDDDLRGCHRYPVSLAADVGISYAEGGRSEYVGLQNTGSRWGSPLASQEIMRDRRVELGMAVKHWLEAGGSIVMGVGTVRHNLSQPLEQVLGGLKSAYRSMVDTPKWRKEDRVIYGITHIFADYEYTWSPDNGCHPHKNMILFLERELSALELEALGGSMFGRWSSGAVKAGLGAPTRERGIYLEQVTGWGADAARAATYLAKGLAEEFTGAATKEAYGKSLTPGQMLDVLGAQDATREGMDPVLVAAYREYEAAFKGLKSSWSRGAKKALGVDFIGLEEAREFSLELVQLTGEEPEESPLGQRFVVASIPAAEWRKIMSNLEIRQRILEAVEAAKSPGEAQRNALVLLPELGVAGVPRMIPMDYVDLDQVLPSHADAVARDLRAHTLAA